MVSGRSMFPTSSQFDTGSFEKPVAFGKVSGNPKLHCELRYFHFTGSLSVSCQERFQRLLRVAELTGGGVLASQISRRRRGRGS